MGDQQTIKFNIRKEMDMSSEGFDRLSSHSKLVFRRKVFKTIYSGEVNHNDIEDGRSLARWLYSKFGGGNYLGFSWKYNKERSKKQFTKALFKVRIDDIRGDSQNAFTYEFLLTTGISRYGFWIGEY